MYFQLVDNQVLSTQGQPDVNLHRLTEVSIFPALRLSNTDWPRREPDATSASMSSGMLSDVARNSAAARSHSAPAPAV